MTSKFIRLIAAAIVISTVFTPAALAQTINSPTLEVLTPSQDQIIYGSEVPILLSVENFQLVDNTTNLKKVNGQGHIHLWLDNQTPAKDNTTIVTNDEFLYKDVPFGEHTLKAELVNNDHTSLYPKVESTLKFKSQEIESPSPLPTAGFDKNTALVIFVVVALVIVAAWWYTKEEDEDEIEKKIVSKRPQKTKKGASKRKKAV